MKKTVSVGEFKEYCDSHSPQKFSIHSVDQEGYCAADPLKFALAFPRVLIYENPNVICLKSGENTVRLDFVRRVEINTGNSATGTIFTVFCGDGRGKGRNYKIFSEPIDFSS